MLGVKPPDGAGDGYYGDWRLLAGASAALCTGVVRASRCGATLLLQVASVTVPGLFMNRSIINEYE